MGRLNLIWEIREGFLQEDKDEGKVEAEETASMWEWALENVKEGVYG